MIRFLFKSALILLCVIGLVAATLWWKLDAVLEIARPEIVSRLSNALARDVSVQSLHATVFPSLRIVAKGIVVKPELVADELSGDVALTPLLGGEVKIRSLRLVRPEVTVGASAREGRLTEDRHPVERSDQDSTISLVLAKLEIVDGLLKVVSQASPVIISNLSMRASGDISVERMDFDDITLSGNEAQIGKFEFFTRSLQYRANSEVLSLKDGEVRLSDIRGRVSGEWSVRDSRGDVSIAIQELSVDSLLFALKTVAPTVPPLLKSYQIAGVIHPEVVIKGRDSGLLMEMSGTVRNGKGSFFGIPIGDAKCSFEVRSEGKVTLVRLSEGQFTAGSKKERLTLSGEYNLNTRSGNARVGTSSVSYETLKPVLDLGLPKGLVLSRAKTKGEIDISIGKSLTVAADLGLSEMSGGYNNTQFDGVQGPLSISYSPSSTVLRSSGLNGNFASSDVRAKFSISLPEQSGEISLKVAPMPVRDLMALGGMAESAWTKDAQGTVAATIEGKFARGVPSYQGIVSVAGIDLPSLTPPVSGLNSAVRLSPGKEGYLVDTKDLSLQFGSESLQGVLKAEISPTDFLIESLSLSTAGGKATISGAVELAGKKRLKLKVDGKNFDAQRVANIILGPERVSLQGTVKSVVGEIKGNRGGELVPTLSGPVSFKFTDGVLKGINLGRVALEKINNLPFIQGRLYDRMSPELQQYFEGEDTVIREMTGAGQFSANGLDVGEVSMWSEHFAIQGAGRYDFSTGADMKTNIAFSPGFSRALQKQVYETKQLMDRSGVFVFPLEISGRPPDLSVQPDVQAIVERALSKAIEKKAGELLDNILGPK